MPSDWCNEHDLSMFSISGWDKWLSLFLMPIKSYNIFHFHSRKNGQTLIKSTKKNNVNDNFEVLLLSILNILCGEQLFEFAIKALVVYAFLPHKFKKSADIALLLQLDHAHFHCNGDIIIL